MKYSDHITKMTNEQIAESCEDAADLLEGHWVQGNWYQNIYLEEDEDDEPSNWGYCLEGGLAAALRLDNISDMNDESRQELLACPVYDAVLETLNQQVRQTLLDAGLSKGDFDIYGHGGLPNWNDADGRTEQEVVDLLRTTAKRVLVMGYDPELGYNDG